MRDLFSKQLMYMSFYYFSIIFLVACIFYDLFNDAVTGFTFGYFFALFYWKTKMITNQKIDVGDVQYSRLSGVLRFTVAANAETVQTVEDITGRTDMTFEEVAQELGKLLSTAIQINYSRGGLRRKYD